jgi:hypothetical protein
MRLYTTTTAASVGNDDHGVFTVDPATSAVEVPDEYGAFLNTLHVDGHKAWETDAERHDRLATEDLERRRDPAAIYDLFESKIGSLAGFDPDVLVAAFATALKQTQGDDGNGRHESTDDPPKPPRARRKAADADPPAE